MRELSLKLLQVFGWVMLAAGLGLMGLKTAIDVGLLLHP